MSILEKGKWIIDFTILNILPLAILRILFFLELTILNLISELNNQTKSGVQRQMLKSDSLVSDRNTALILECCV